MRSGNRLVIWVLALLLLGVGLMPRRASAADAVPKQFVVQLKPGSNILTLLLGLGLQLLAKSQYANVYLVQQNSLGGLLFNVLDLLRLDQDVVAADPNLISGALQSGQTSDATQLCSTFDGNGSPQAYQGQYSVTQVDYNRAAQIADGSGVTVAVLDTGISKRNAALGAQVVPGWNYLNNNSGTDDVPTGCDSDRNGVPDQAAGHGTFIAGIVSRFAPKAKLMPIKVLDSDGHGTLWAAVEGIRGATARGAKVLNLSFGFSHNAGTLNQAVNDAYKAGALVVTAAGNNNSSSPQFPAGIPNALAVAGLNSDNTKASFSNYGSAVAVDAPGVKVVSIYWDGSYAYWSGTSFSAPMAAAEGALLFSRNPGEAVDTVKARILSTSHSVNNYNPSYVNQLGKNGAGLIDFDAALSQSDHEGDS